MRHTIVAALAEHDAPAPAVGLAVALARPAGASLVLGAVVDRSRVMPVHRNADERLVRLREHLATTAAGVPADLPTVVDGVVSTSAVRGFHELAQRHDAQLLVLAQRHGRSLGRTLHGDRTADAVFTAECGVAVAGATPLTHAPRRIGVAWDHSAEAGEALEWAVQLAERTGGTVEIVHVAGDHGADEERRDRARTMLERLREAAAPRATAEITIAWGEPSELFAHIGERFDLLIMGSRRRSPLRRALTGSFSATVMHATDCALVVLPRGVTAPLDTAAI
jgi:nucleotide-binding universal stress UspA family protein